MTNSIFSIKTHIESILKALKIIKEIKPDLIHTNSTTAGIIGRLCRFLTKTPVVFTVRGWPYTLGIPHYKQLFYALLESFLSFFTKKIICVSEFDRKLVIKVMPYSKNKTENYFGCNKLYCDFVLLVYRYIPNAVV